MSVGQITAALKRKPLSSYAALAVGLSLVIEPVLPQYHFSLFWFSLGAAALIVALWDLFRKH